MKQGYKYEYNTTTRVSFEKLLHDTAGITLVYHEYDTPNKVSILPSNIMGFIIIYFCFK